MGKNIIESLCAVIHDRADDALKRLDGVIADKNNRNLGQLKKIHSDLKEIVDAVTSTKHINDYTKTPRE